MSATSGGLKGRDETAPSVPYYKLPWSKSFTAPAGSPGHQRLAWPPVIAATAMGLALVAIMLPGRPVPTGATVATRIFRIDQRSGGVVVLRDAATRQSILALAHNGDGFMRGVLHSVAVRRMKYGVSQETPLLLTATADGRLILADVATKTKIDLEAFGSANEAAFARLLPHSVQEASR